MYLRNSVPLKCRVKAGNLLKKLVLRWFVNMKWDRLTVVARDQLSITNCHARRKLSFDAYRFFFRRLIVLFYFYNLFSLNIFDDFIILRDLITLALKLLCRLSRNRNIVLKVSVF